MDSINLQITKKQRQFIEATEDEVLYGGAAGGGKSYAQLIDAYLFALQHRKSKQLILRRTFPDLERSLIRVSRDMYRQDLCEYNASKHTYRFINGSIIDFGYLQNEGDVYQYQSAEYDIIRFDELTHFTDFQYTYMLSRIRGANPYPKQAKSSTNPGNVGHGWVRARWIDMAPAGTHFETPKGSRIFIPAKVQDNKFLMEHDPEYVRRLENLPEEERKALLYGSWDVFKGQYFTEWNRDIHVVDPFEIPKDWRRFRAMDWGYNDPCVCLWFAVAPDGHLFVYREKTHRETLSSVVAENIVDITGGESIAYSVASPDMWQKRGHSDIDGENIAETFGRHGMPLISADNSRVIGWQRVREYLQTAPDGKPYLQIFSNCLDLIRTIPLMIYDDHNVEDVGDNLPDHWCEALRYGCMSRPSPNKVKQEKPKPPASDPLNMFHRERRSSFGF